MKKTIYLGFFIGILFCSFTQARHAIIKVTSDTYEVTITKSQPEEHSCVVDSDVTRYKNTKIPPNGKEIEMHVGIISAGCPAAGQWDMQMEDTDYEGKKHCVSFHFSALWGGVKLTHNTCLGLTPPVYSDTSEGNYEKIIHFHL